ncbi:acetylornithine/succinylornithine family transaminase [bacterium]|nr:acetylornithine/succinylornithine family transaminase [bacterium]|tara:strand:+ start:9940 stop:11139 length:1200 start_codon:yes stop_codon:yes gene_type:complete
MKQNNILAKNNKYLIENYQRYPIEMVRGNGSYVWDSKGKKYLDFISGIAVNNLGHNNQKVNKAINSQLNKMLHISNLFVIKEQVNYAKELSKTKKGYRTFFCNSGTEANEAAFKLARRWGVLNGGKKTIVSFSGAFHGRTFGSLSATSPKKYRYGFYPLTPGFKSIKFNDIDKLNKLVNKDKKIAAIIVEPIQGEAGVKFSDIGFLKAVQDICNNQNILFILDEVQVGIGRTGKVFCHEHFNLKPDIITLAKALGGGLPCGAMMVNPRFADSLSPGSHGTTMGGNPLSMVAGLSSFKQIANSKFLASVEKKGKLFLKQLKIFEKNSFIKEVRGLGLILAIEFHSDQAAKIFCSICLKKGLLVILTEKYNVRILPPLNVKINEIKEAIEIFTIALEQINE